MGEQGSDFAQPGSEPLKQRRYYLTSAADELILQSFCSLRAKIASFKKSSTCSSLLVLLLVTLMSIPSIQPPGYPCFGNTAVEDVDLAMMSLRMP